MRNQGPCAKPPFGRPSRRPGGILRFTFRSGGIAAASLLFALTLWASAVPVEAAVEVPGRIVLELTEAGARALRAGTLEVPLPAGGEALDPRLEPLFVSRTGPLARFALLTFNAAAGGAGNREWIETLSGSPNVLRGQSDLLLETAALPDDPYFLGDGGLPAQKQLYNPGGLSLQATRAWPFVPAGNDVVVAIIDSGVDWRHPDLGGTDPPATGVLWRNEAEYTGLDDVDDDGNGYVDDIIGWDFVDLPREFPGGITVHPLEDDADEDNDPSDFAGHGTQAAGYVTALTDNGIGIAGAAPGARIMSLRAGWLTGPPSYLAVVYMTYTARAIEYAALNGAKVINCSWDSSEILGMAEAADLAINTYDVVIVASAGNQGTSIPTANNPQYLGQRDDVLAVGGILFSGVKASGSNYGDWVDIAAFFKETTTTWFDRGTLTSSYYMNPLGGTSFAAPQVTGQAALLRLARPDASAAEVRGWIETTGMDLSELDPTFGTRLGGGLADYAASVQAAAGGWDGSRGARKLTGHGVVEASHTAPVASQVAFFGENDLEVADAADGSPAPGWTIGIPVSAGAAELYPLSVPWDGYALQLLVWAEGNALHAVSAPGSEPAGWPVALPDGYGQPAAVPSGTYLVEPAIYVPHGDGVLLVEPDAVTGVKTSSIDLPVDRIAVGQLDADAAWEVAGIDAGGMLRVYDPDDEGGSTTWSVEVGDVTAGPMIVEFDHDENGVVILAASDPAAPETLQELHRIGAGGTLHEQVSLSAPPVRHLSVSWFAGSGTVEVLGADEAGGIHTFDAGPPVLDAGGPLAGEVITADLDRDHRPELLALRTDGTLLAWSDVGAGGQNIFEMYAGFPRRFPNGAAEAPLVLDDNALRGRYAVVADTAGGIWTLPVGKGSYPLVWPGALGGAQRNSYANYIDTTPVAASAVLQRNGDDLCWSGTGLDGYAGLRVRAAASGTVLWEGTPADDGCADLSGVPGGGRVVLEGLDRAEGWQEIAALDISVTPAFRLAAPRPNPFHASTRIEWSGTPGEVRVRVFDVAGRMILGRTVAGGADGFVWDGRDDRGRVAPPGLYFLRVAGTEGAAVRRVVKLP